MEVRSERRRSRGRKNILTLVGTLESFEEGDPALMPRLTGASVPASALRRATDAEGEKLAARRRRGQASGPDV